MPKLNDDCIKMQVMDLVEDIICIVGAVVLLDICLRNFEDILFNFVCMMK